MPISKKKTLKNEVGFLIELFCSALRSLSGVSRHFFVSQGIRREWAAKIGFGKFRGSNVKMRIEVKKLLLLVILCKYTLY